MKNIVVIFLSGCIFITGCNNEPIKDRTPPKYTDSFIKAEQDKIIGDLRFGMNEKETKREIERLNKQNTRNKYIGNNQYNILNGKYIGNYEYYDIDANYDSNKLYCIKIDGIGDDPYEEEQELIKLMEQKYGYKDYSDYDTLDKKSISRWVIGEKNIEITCRIRISTDIKIYKHDIERKVIERRKDREKFLKDSLANSAKNVF